MARPPWASISSRSRTRPERDGGSCGGPRRDAGCRRPSSGGRLPGAAAPMSARCFLSCPAPVRQRGTDPRRSARGGRRSSPPCSPRSRSPSRRRGTSSRAGTASRTSRGPRSRWCNSCCCWCRSTALLLGVMALLPDRGAAELLYSQPASRAAIQLGQDAGAVRSPPGRPGHRIRGVGTRDLRAGRRPGRQRVPLARGRVRRAHRDLPGDGRPDCGGPGGAPAESRAGRCAGRVVRPRRALRRRGHRAWRRSCGRAPRHDC